MALTVRSSQYRPCTTLLVLLCLLAVACGPERTPAPRPVTEVAQVPVDTPIPPTASPAPSPTATSLPSLTPQPTVEQEKAESTAASDAALLEGVIAAVEAAIAEEPWRLENYHYLHDAHLEMAARRPLYELDAEIAGYDERLEDHPEDARVYVERGRAKYQRTVLSWEQPSSWSTDMQNPRQTVPRLLCITMNTSMPLATVS